MHTFTRKGPLYQCDIFDTKHVLKSSKYHSYIVLLPMVEYEWKIY